MKIDTKGKKQTLTNIKYKLITVTMPNTRDSILKPS